MGKEKSGGLAAFWHESIMVQLRKCSDRYICLEVQERGDTPRWSLTFVYGEPGMEDRKHMWELLQRLKKLSPLAWLVTGDFNEATWGFNTFLNGRWRLFERR